MTDRLSRQATGIEPLFIINDGNASQTYSKGDTVTIKTCFAVPLPDNCVNERFIYNHHVWVVISVKFGDDRNTIIIEGLHE